MDNILHMPSPLERLADKLRGFLSKDAANRQEWIEIQEGKCLTLAEMRDQFPADIEFGHWCDENGFGKEVVDHRTRAAAITMGRQPEALRECLEVTERKSLEAICRFEFRRFTNVRKPKSRSAEPKPRGRRPTKVPPAMVEEALRRLNAGEPINKSQLGEMFDLGKNTVERAIVEAQTEFKLRTSPEVAPLPPPDMSATMQQRYDAQLALAKKRLREELKIEVTAEVHKIYDGYIKYYNERIVRAEQIIASHRGIMDRAMFRKIKASLHPDHSTFQHAAEALRLFSELEDVLVKPETPALKGPPLPQTAVELMAQRKRYR